MPELAQHFRIRQQRVMAIIALKDMEKEEAGALPRAAGKLSAAPAPLTQPLTCRKSRRASHWTPRCSGRWRADRVRRALLTAATACLHVSPA